MGGGGGDGDRAMLPSVPLAEFTLALVGKIGTGKSATANCILGTQAFVAKRSFNTVTKTCEMGRATFQDRGGATRTVNVVDTPGLFGMDVSIEDARKEIVKCIKMTKDGIHAMLIVLSAASRFSHEEHSAVESIKMFFGDKILDHIILVFTHGDALDDEIDWKEMLTVGSPVYLQDMLERCQNRVVLFDNKNKVIDHREMQRGKLLDAVDFVISRNRGNAFSYQMLPGFQEAIDTQTESTLDGYIAEKITEHLEQITNTVNEKLKSREEEIRALSESLEKSQEEHDNIKQEMENAENLKKLDEEKRKAQEEKLEKRRRVKISSIEEKIKLIEEEQQCYMYMQQGKRCIIM